MKDLILTILFLIGMVSVSPLKSAGVEMENPITISSIEQTQETCNLGNGTLTINVTGTLPGLEYSIDAGATYQSSNFFDNLQSGDYLIIVRSASLCSEVRSIQIADAPEPEVSIMNDCVPGRNLSNITAVVIGGIFPYTYEWSGNGIQESDEILTNVTPGEYYLLVTDNLGCTIRDTVLIEECCELKTNCDLPTLELACMTAIPAVDFASLNVLDFQEQKDSLAVMGITVEKPCSDINIAYQDVEENNPTNCSDGPLVLTRTITVSDDYISFDCRQRIEVQNSTAPTIDERPSDLVSSCSDESAFRNWLDNKGGMMITGCTEPYTYSTVPADPVAPLSCNEEIEVTFVVMDACGNALSSAASFTVMDTEKPELACPADITVDAEDPDLMVKINDWLTSITVADNCDDSIAPDNDFDANQLTLDCSQSLEQPVTFSAQDQCGNGSECLANISIGGLALPELSCGEHLTMDCSETDRITAVQNWIRTFTAQDGDGIELTIDNDLDLTALEALPCNISMLVNFSIIDDCNRTLDCSREIIIIDDEQPVLDCPAQLELSVSDSDPMATITPWLAEATASDNCDSDPVLTNDFSSLDDLCEVASDLVITFEVVDACGNSNNCQATITVIHAMPVLTCPDPLVLNCGAAMADEQVAEWLSAVVATGNDGNNIDNDFSGLAGIEPCGEVQTITFTTNNTCGNAADCNSTFMIIDEEAPEIICPQDLEFDLGVSDASNQITSWLESVTATDCNTYTINDDYGLDFSNIICEESEIITFVAEDRCGLTSSCSATLNLINTATIEIICPENIWYNCSDPHLEFKINTLLSEIEVITSSSYQLENNFNPLDLLPDDCLQDGLEIEVVAIDACDNETTCLTLINFRPSPEIYIPNIITPDSDGFNDYFTAFGNESVDYIASMTIFNKWGSKIFDVSDIAINEEREGWDGRYGVEDENINVYTYHLVIIDTNGNEIDKVGTIQILK